MDFYKGTVPGLDSPASGLFEISPDDTADLPIATRALNATTAGKVRVTAVDGTEGVVFLSAGIVFPLRVRRVWATGTDAAGLTGLY